MRRYAAVFQYQSIGIVKRLKFFSVGPPAAQYVVAQIAFADIGVVHIGNLQFAAR